MRRRELDSRLLILVTLALVAFGLVMVYSATSAPAAVGGRDPNYYLERQGIYAALGIVLMIVAQRWDYRRLQGARADARPRLARPARRGARRRARRSTARAAGSPSGRPSSSRPSSRSSRSRSGRRRTSRAGRRRGRCSELWRPLGALACVFAVLLVLEPDLGTTIALVLMLVGMLVVAGHAGARARCGARDRVGAPASPRSG